MSRTYAEFLLIHWRHQHLKNTRELVLFYEEHLILEHYGFWESVKKSKKKHDIPMENLKEKPIEICSDDVIQLEIS